MIKKIFLKSKDKYFSKSYSQEGEDMILMRIFEKQNNGFYIDVGALHPKRFSNTYYFYLKGWRGINIDATPGSMKKFNKTRPNDINIEQAVSDKKTELTFYMFNEPALNTFSEKIKDNLLNTSNYRLINKQKLQTKKLCEIFQENLAQNQTIDFISIDVEGYDFEVLKSNDWDTYIPKVILIESHFNSLESISNSNNLLFEFLKNKNYTLYAKTINTLIFIKNEEISLLI